MLSEFTSTTSSNTRIIREVLRFSVNASKRGPDASGTTLDATLPLTSLMLLPNESEKALDAMEMNVLLSSVPRLVSNVIAKRSSSQNVI